ncbi:MAG TPA: 16S rRNA (uracil(1498)-N(3))-methyltransferase [Rhodospirillaceae bacterium]|nr:MAG: 16S rRNA (uracil(1498)-N(3))-methyltransferase [Alphaproteobacteria bacterium GWF2_58_20]HAU28530.1 16S rRNA (uracil(1498)-N(3))-methyltransferase [Rhodospirillaceae bacterium]
MQRGGHELIRLFVEDPLSQGFLLGLDATRAHYLIHVMRMNIGDSLLVFNGRDGEWHAEVEGTGKGWCSLKIGDKTRDRGYPSDLWLLMAAIKKPRMAIAVEKATELGAGLIWPVITRHTVMANVNSEKLSLTAIEAAEQCERLDVPDVRPPTALMDILSKWPEGRSLVVCAETGNARPAMDVFSGWAREPAHPTAILVGPEGGFAKEELEYLASLPFVHFIGLGPRILRAETAAITALSLWQATCGDFGLPPRGEPD